MLLTLQNCDNNSKLSMIADDTAGTIISDNDIERPSVTVVSQMI